MAIRQVSLSSVTKQTHTPVKSKTKELSKTTNKDLVAVIEKHVASRLAKFSPNDRSVITVKYEPWVYEAEKFVYSPASVCLPLADSPERVAQVRRLKQTLLQKSTVKIGQLTFKIYGSEDWLKDTNSISLYYELL